MKPKSEYPDERGGSLPVYITSGFPVTSSLNNVQITHTDDWLGQAAVAQVASSSRPVIWHAQYIKPMAVAASNAMATMDGCRQQIPSSALEALLHEQLDYGQLCCRLESDHSIRIDRTLLAKKLLEALPNAPPIPRSPQSLVPDNSFTYADHKPTTKPRPRPAEVNNLYAREDNLMAEAASGSLLGTVLASEETLRDTPKMHPVSSWQLERGEKLQELLGAASPEILEAESRKYQSQLERIKTLLEQISETNQQAKQWLTQLESTSMHNVAHETIIGVVGNTGAGKSSVINALLDEERLVPTNCMRACTAVVTQMSWNASEDAAAKYRAEIEFITPEDWAKELRVLFAEVLDANGSISREAYTADSDAGIAFAKIKAVYPHKTNEMLASSSVDELMKESIMKVLGTVKLITESGCETFYRRLQYFVDSKEKVAKQGEKEARQVEYWPLIRVVKLYIKAAALKTGAVVVDLPGVHDSNAARSAVAARYMKQCTGLWIVAPITRAVDDKAAKNLLGETFKRQLKYDGTYSRVTFICSKTDDISITEASDSLGLEAEMSSKWQERDEIDEKARAAKERLDELKKSLAIYNAVMNESDETLDIWEKLQEELEDGSTVYAPEQKSAKRKSSPSTAQRRKRQRTANHSERPDDTEDDSLESEGDEGESEVGAAEATSQEPLTAEQIEAKIVDLKANKKRCREKKREINASISESKGELSRLKSKGAAIESEMSSVCISGRNKYSRSAIQQDFAAGIRDLDQENAIEADEDSFDPEEDLRDYDEVAKSLPVFCVSSRAYQKLCGRLQRDSDVPGFHSIEETEIPQLRAHCGKLTETGRAAAYRRFLNSFHQLTKAMFLWASDDGSELNLSDTQLAVEARFLKAQMERLEKAMEAAVEGCIKEMREVLSENICEKFESIIQLAVNKANSTVEKWGLPINRGDRAAGGYFYSTYKAIVRRDGVYTNAQGPHNFNEDLTKPMMKHLATHWEKAFSRRLPAVLQSFSKKVMPPLKSFHETIQSRGMQQGMGLARLSMLGDQLHNYERIFNDLQTQVTELMNALQRDANREFTPVIAQALASAYVHCTADSGPGVFKRMKEHMSTHVDQERHRMFHKSTEEVKTRLTKMCREVEEVIADMTDSVFLQMKRDYLTVFTGSSQKITDMPKSHRKIMADIAKIIEEPAEEPKHSADQDREALAEEQNHAGDVAMNNSESTKDDNNDTSPDVVQVKREATDVVDLGHE